MHWTGRALFTCMILSALSGCNTTDALTPQVDVGGGLFPSAGNSSPVSQDEAARLAARPDMPSVTSSDYPAAPRAVARGPERRAAQDFSRGPSAGEAKALDEPTDTEGPSAITSAPLAAPANSAPDNPAPDNPAPANPASANPASANPESESSASVAMSASSLRFLPIIGAPVQAVTPLSRQLGASARASGLTIKSSSDNSSEHILKGYLSAFDSEGKVTVVYVWDVLDANGGRLHRIQGQESVPAGNGEPWAAVPPATMQIIGQKTIGNYVEWLQAQRR
ncbi:hypothetical protein [Rhizobium sp. SSA_523]|uniref:hypothetical protein n=1 Tax=Rhizobium sp. SSA_523 TaxID=2952477 RepID=UPI002090B4F1|nr:hypothetical protein [Rhizobium sp. SSA_523]MCO5730406.1 hypothetical protein [Rhizobium sp. SSA_523]WKC25450.1 hypothetical protein QTJ18_15920 [Rhizobium sp. SSA_523]